MHLLDPRRIRVTRGLVLLSAAALAGLQAAGEGRGAAGLALALGTGLYVCLTALLPVVARAVDRDDSQHQIALTAVDMLVITAIVWLTGGVQSEYFLLYYWPVVYAALRLNARDGIAATALVVVLYVFVTVADDTQRVIVTSAGLRALSVVVSAAIMMTFFGILRREVRAYENLRESLHNALRTVSAVYDVAHAANTGAGLSSVLSILLDQAALATGADRGYIALIEDGQRLEVAATLGPGAEAHQARVNEPGSPAREAVARQAPVDCPAEPGRARPEGWAAGRSVYVPLITPGGPIGVLALFSRSARRLRRSHVEFLQTLSLEAATAVENVQLRGKLHLLATTDHLTGLFNRREAERHLATESERARRYRRPLTVLMVDLDNLKDVNDRCGHAVGDQVLAALGRVLKAELRSSDSAGRMGGDEFLVVLPEVGASGGMALANRVTARFGQELAVLGSLVETGSPVGMSVGLAYTEDGALGAPQLLSQADQALYEAKRAGKGRIGAAPSCSPRELAAAAAHGQAGG